MKKILVLLCLLLVVIGPSYSLPQFKGYKIVLFKTAKLPTGEKIIIYGLEARGRGIPQSYLAIQKADKDEMIYRLHPVAPAEVNYPRPLRLEKIEVVTRKNQLYIVTAWGETGADYWGTHPLVIAYKEGRFKMISLYPGYLSNSPDLKAQKDFTVKNHFDPEDSARTILTQGVSLLKGGGVVLSFYGDDKPRAAKHKYVTFTFSLP